ncbi:MAG: hypothetical protein MJE77_01535 [Proteobacteria bacterium]|nr:hypothetical protein [Pseudomonadota bacterium]
MKARTGKYGAIDIFRHEKTTTGLESSPVSAVGQTPTLYTLQDNQWHLRLQELYRTSRLDAAETLLTEYELRGFVGDFSALNWSGLIELARGHMGTAELLLTGALGCAETAAQRSIALENVAALKIMKGLPMVGAAYCLSGFGLGQPVASCRGLWANFTIALAQLRNEGVLEQAVHLIASNLSAEEYRLFRQLLAASSSGPGGELDWLHASRALDATLPHVDNTRGSDLDWCTDRSAVEELSDQHPWLSILNAGAWASLAVRPLAVVVRGG